MIRALFNLLGVRGSAIALVAFVGAIWGYGALEYNAGFNDGEAAVWAEVRAVEQEKQLQVFKLADKLSIRTAELQAERAERAKQIERLEDEAQADNPDSRVPSGNSLRRLEARWN